MSYDVVIMTADLLEDLYYTSHSSNTSVMWRTAGLRLHEFNNKTTNELLPDLIKAIESMKHMPDYYKAMDGNEWGDYGSTLAFLESIEQACVTYPDGVLEISW